MRKRVEVLCSESPMHACSVFGILNFAVHCRHNPYKCVNHGAYTAPGVQQLSGSAIDLVRCVTNKQQQMVPQPHQHAGKDGNQHPLLICPHHNWKACLSSRLQASWQEHFDILQLLLMRQCMMLMQSVRWYASWQALE